MAHADYNCCAICDSKMDYNGWCATTKEEICEGCFIDIIRLGLKIKNIDDLKEYIKTGEYSEVKENLLKLGFSFCHYSNEIDDLVSTRFLPIYGETLKEVLDKLK